MTRRLELICDYCGKVINKPFSDYHGDLDMDCLAVIEVKVVSLNSTREYPDKPDLCRECIINTLRG